MAVDTSYGHERFPSMGPFLFSGQFLLRRLTNLFQGGLNRQDNIVAFAGGGGASATQLYRSVNRVTTVATAADSCALPAAIAGSMVWVINAGANSLTLYPKVGSGNTINGGASLAQAAAKTRQYICVTAGAWLLADYT